MQWKSSPRPGSASRDRPVRSSHQFSLHGLLGLLAIGVAVLLLGSGGCGSNKGTSFPTTSSTLEKPRLRIGWPKEGDPALFRDFLSRWAAEHKTTLEMVGYDSREELPQLPEVDLCVLDPAALPRWAAAGQLQPLQADRARAFRETDYLDAYRQLLTWDGKRYALPLRGELFLAVYRTDLFHAQGQAFQAKFGRPLKPPHTWEEWEQVAAFFHEVSGSCEQRLHALPPLPADDLELEREFYAMAASAVRRGSPDAKASTLARYSFQFNVETGEPWIDTPGFVHALQLLQRLQRYRAARPASDTLAAFRDGQAVLCLAPLSPWVARFQAAGSPARDRFGFAAVPGSRVAFDPETGQLAALGEVNRVPYLGADGWVGVIPKTASRPEAAAALLAWVNEPRIAREVATSPGCSGPFLKEHRQTSILKWDELTLGPHVNELVAALSTSVENPHAANPTFRLRMPDEQQFRQALAARLRPAIVDNVDALSVLKAVAEDWRALLRKKGAANHRADYRRSLGLDP